MASVAWQNTVARHKVQAEAVNDNAEDDDLFEDGPNRRVYLARWPDGSATLLTARSLVEVADLLDEIGDPGGCEVAPYDGAVCVHLRPQPSPEAGWSRPMRVCGACGTVSGTPGGGESAA